MTCPRITSLLLALVASACGAAPASQTVARPNPAAASAAPRPVATLPNFAPGRLQSHFEKHGAEFGYRTAEEYLQGARALVAGGEGVETLARGADTLYYRATTNEFGVMSRERVIRTYFKPVQGAKYFTNQKRR
jgi:pyocin large subunit-like protein